MNDSGLPPVSPVSTGKGFSIAGLVLGILSVILAWFYLINIVALVFGIIGLVMAVLGRNRAKAAGVSSGLGTAGLVLSIIGLSLAFIGFITCTLCVYCAAQATGETVEGVNSCINQLDNL